MRLDSEMKKLYFYFKMVDDVKCFKQKKLISKRHYGGGDRTLFIKDFEGQVIQNKPFSSTYQIQHGRF